MVLRWGKLTLAQISAGLEVAIVADTTYSKLIAPTLVEREITRVLPQLGMQHCLPQSHTDSSPSNPLGQVGMIFVFFGDPLSLSTAWGRREP